MGRPSKGLTARDFRNIEESFKDLLRHAPGDKEDKQQFIRDRTKQLVSKKNYDRMLERLIDVAGRAGAGELIFDYVLETADDRLINLLDEADKSGRAKIAPDDKKIVDVLFFSNGKPKRITEHLLKIRKVVIGSGTLTPGGRNPGQNRSEFQYDVALSLAGESREYVRGVARDLDERGTDVFFDEFEEADLWGKDLASHLEKVYREAARYCVLFISEAYAEKAWPQHEAQAALARQVEEMGEYILPVQLDDTRLEGLSPSIKYVDGRQYSPSELAELISEKLRS